MATDKKTLQQVQFTPADCVKFEGKIEETRKQEVTITNPTESIITFKCKGTSPEHIKIRPGYGYIKPTEKVVVTITVLPLNTRPRPPTNERLVVLLGVAPPDHPQSPLKMWRGSSIPKDPRRVVIPLKFAGFFQEKKEDTSTPSLDKQAASPSAAKKTGSSPSAMKIPDSAPMPQKNTPTT